MEENKVIKASVEARVREIGGNTYLIPLNNRIATTSKLFILNKVAREIWDYVVIKPQVELEEVYAFVENKYKSIETSVIKNDVNKFVKALGEIGFIKEI